MISWYKQMGQMPIFPKNIMMSKIGLKKETVLAKMGCMVTLSLLYMAFVNKQYQINWLQQFYAICYYLIINDYGPIILDQFSLAVVIFDLCTFSFF